MSDCSKSDKRVGSSKSKNINYDDNYLINNNENIDENKVGNLEYDIPSDFKLNVSSTSDFKRYYIDTESDLCGLSIRVSKYYDNYNVESYFELKDNNKTNSTINQHNINRRTTDICNNAYNSTINSLKFSS